MKLLIVASECAPFVKTGGLADVVASIPQALMDLGAEVKVLIPGYGSLGELLASDVTDFRIPDLFGGSAVLRHQRINHCDLLILDAPHLYGREGNPYVDTRNHDWADNPIRFAALAAAGAKLATQGVDGWKPDVVSIHDWQTGLLPIYLKQTRQATPPVVMTIHNIAYQGIFSPELLPELGIESHYLESGGIEYYGNIGFLKAGLVYSDWVTTVSPGYSRELMTAEFGMGLEGVLNNRAKSFTGILNGIDTQQWNPATDSSLARTYTANNVNCKQYNRQLLGKLFELDLNPDKPLICIVSRLVDQKGIDLVIEAMPRLVDLGVQLIVLGEGDPVLEHQLKQAQYRYPDNLSVRIGYSEKVSHQMQGGSDAILIPSRFEPCGLTQLLGLRYGTIPVVSRTGGLSDTVINANDAAIKRNTATGIVFERDSASAIVNALHRLTELFSDTACWQNLIHNAMEHPVDWKTSARQYYSLFDTLVTRHA